MRWEENGDKTRNLHEQNYAYMNEKKGDFENVFTNSIAI